MTSFHFELVAPERLLFSGDVESVILSGTEGEMTVLADQAPAMTTLKPGIVTYAVAGGATKKLLLTTGAPAAGASHDEDRPPPPPPVPAPPGRDGTGTPAGAKASFIALPVSFLGTAFCGAKAS